MTQAFADELAYFADTVGCPHLSPIIDRLRRPIRVAVGGRRGVGRATVAAALGQTGVTVLPDGTGSEAAEVHLRVIAETVKPEDRFAVTSSPAPTVMVLTKADLAGAGPGGPMVPARRRATVIASTTGVPTVPVIGLLAALEGLDEELIVALRSFVTEPADLTSVDAFLDAAHDVRRDVRARLLTRLDRFGIAHAVLALAGGTDPAELTTHLRRLGNLDEVSIALEAAAVPARYLRIPAAIAELHSLAVTLDDRRLSDLATSDGVVLAAMTAAVDVVETAGLAVDRGDTRTAHVDRAVRWRRYGRGPVDAVHRRCSADIVTGSLRLLAERST